MSGASSNADGANHKYRMTISTLFLYFLIALVIAFYVRRVVASFLIRSYSPSQVADLLKAGNIVLLDVRTESERRTSNIPGSIHIPLHHLTRRMNGLEKQKSKEIVCYCQSGNRSLTAAMKLRKAGFNVANMKGGIAEWNFQQLRRP